MALATRAARRPSTLATLWGSTVGKKTVMAVTGVILALFIVWHILDLTTLTVNPRAEAGHPYQNVVADFHTWYADVIYIVAMLALGMHIRHGFWSAAQTLGANSRRRDRALKWTAD